MQSRAGVAPPTAKLLPKYKMHTKLEFVILLFDDHYLQSKYRYVCPLTTAAPYKSFWNIFKSWLFVSKVKVKLAPTLTSTFTQKEKSKTVCLLAAKYTFLMVKIDARAGDTN